MNQMNSSGAPDEKNILFYMLNYDSPPILKAILNDTVKLSKVKRLPNRTELNTSSSRRTALELFYYFCVFFSKSSVRFDRNELQN